MKDTEAVFIEALKIVRHLAFPVSYIRDSNTMTQKKHVMPRRARLLPIPPKVFY
jgi:hypothetical protein